jgi:hypothetical protein
MFGAFPLASLQPETTASPGVAPLLPPREETTSSSAVVPSWPQEGGDDDSSGYDDARGGADCYADIDSAPRRRGRARIGNFRACLGEGREGERKIISGT